MYVMYVCISCRRVLVNKLDRPIFVKMSKQATVINGGVKKRKFFWKGKRVTEKVYQDRIRLAEIGKNLQNVVRKQQKTTTPNLNGDDDNNNWSMLQGRRIIDIQTFAKNMICVKCKAVLSLLDCKAEKQLGMAWIYHIKCRLCGDINIVSSDKRHRTEKSKVHFDVNTKAVIGNIINLVVYNKYLYK